jgi:hypothetical protein
MSLEYETMGSHSKTVTWIFVVTVTIIIGSSLLGAWDFAQNGNNHHLQQEDIELPFVAKNKNLEEDSSDIQYPLELPHKIMTSSENSEDSFSGAIPPGTGDVSVPEKGWVCGLDTVPGEMIIYDMSPVALDPLPLKITDDVLDPYWVIVGVTGGYTWVDGYIKVIQKKANDCIDWCVDVKGIIDIDAILMPWDFGEHGWEYYNLTFTVEGDHPIVLDANHPPIDLGDFCLEFDQNNLDKFVSLKIVTEWKGCHLPEQHFKVILAHKAMSQEEIPNSR